MNGIRDSATTSFVAPPASAEAQEIVFALKVWDAAQAKDMLLSVLDDLPGPARDIVLLNAGAAIYVADRAATLGEGIELAREAIVSGAAREKLNQLVAFSHRGKEA